ncbi:MAG: acyltransferase family protein [Acidimicrobiales bacterium]|jgi:1-acyl-sn-glycerol-3-phosphate acyltransferase|nr:acyltransferase family protein [Acidimicrobiales bacterium]
MDQRTPAGDAAARGNGKGNGHAGSGEHLLTRPFLDFVEQRIEQELDEPVLQRDPAFIDRVLPVMRATSAYFDPEVRGFDRLPDAGPFLVISNHSGGMYMPDLYAFMLRWFTERGTETPLYSLAYDFLFQIPGMGAMARRVGSLPASHENAAMVLRAGAPVLVYPGGDADAYRPWTERHRVDLHGRKGFIRLALREQVPIVPMVSHGSHDIFVVLTRGEWIAKAAGFDEFKMHIFPIVAGLPWGLAPANVPVFPLPAKVTVQVCEPMAWPHLPPEAADDEQVVQHCYEEVLGRMQSNLDELVLELPHPVAARVAGLAGGAVRGLGRAATSPLRRLRGRR